MQKILQNVSIGHNIQQIRLSKKWTQPDVVGQLELLGRNLSVTHYGHIEQGRKNIFASDLVLLKRIFNVPYDAFFEDLVP